MIDRLLTPKRLGHLIAACFGLMLFNSTCGSWQYGINNPIETITITSDGDVDTIIYMDNPLSDSLARLDLSNQPLQKVIFYGDTIWCRWGADWSKLETCKDCFLDSANVKANINLASLAMNGLPKKKAPKTKHAPIRATAPGFGGKTIVYANADERTRKQLKYVSRFAEVAQKEMKKYGIPASIKLAQGLLESNAGESPLAKSNNNHFGIKCFAKNCKKGHCSNYTDDSHKDFFRKYNNAWESYRAHSHLLRADRYKPLYKLSSTDYKGWARGLKKAGYATDKYYADKLVNLIERLDLHQYDEDRIARK